MTARDATLALIRPSLRLVPWATLVGSLLASAAILWLVRRNPATPANVVISTLRIAAVPVVAALAFVLDDPTGDDLVPTPVSRSRRLAVRLGLALPLAAGGWWALTAWAGAAPQFAFVGGLPFSVLLEAVALALLGLAVASLVVRRRPVGSGAAAAVVVTVALLISLPLLPERISLLGSVTDPIGWAAAHGRWASLAVVCAALVVLVSRDPGRRPLRALLHPARPRPRPPAAVAPPAGGRPAASASAASSAAPAHDRSTS